ncbi:FAD-binding domain-containing protein [Bimuria novae-zelandiae CBS 107.79]|uniref:D-lactate dehydrogenase (cytochrome) n=1 Tax=Bimuria novae-zelandiae CBS 107.79 TaxID=1447943 RepID=A0A6A5ULH0_9PLEO|nr:FAD-binding domain-containing protein [Bimuria novae-zelandiae CBS 107.79]
MAESDKSTLAPADYPPRTYNHSPSSIAALIRVITQASPSISYSINPTDLVPTASTPHSYAPPEQVAKAVFYPSTTEDVSVILKECHTRRVAVTAYSGGTSLPGALANARGGVCVHFGKMDRVLGVGEGGLDVRVQPGVGWVEVNAYLAPKGLFFPVDPAPGAKIGGMIAMSCSGTNAYRYGTMKEWVISITAVLADGTVITTRKRPRKSSAGYDLTHLIIGSEGTLALVTEAVLKITPLPQNLHVGLATFPTLQAGVDTALAILKSGHLLEAIELADKECMQAINHSSLAKQHMAETPTLFVKFAGSKETVDSQIAFVKKTCEENRSTAFEASNSKERVETIWGARKCIGNALVTMKTLPTDHFLSTDAAVPIPAMATLIQETARIIQNQPFSTENWFCANVGHVGDGNVHTAIVCPVEDKEKAEQVLVEVQRLALRLEGTITGEHGVGLKLRGMLVEEVGEEGVGVMRSVKRALDPRGILNPDKVFMLDGEESRGNVKLEKL